MEEGRVAKKRRQSAGNHTTRHYSACKGSEWEIGTGVVMTMKGIEIEVLTTLIWRAKHRTKAMSHISKIALRVRNETV